MDGLYRFVDNEPIGFIDPLGLWKFNSDGNIVIEKGDTLSAISQGTPFSVDYLKKLNGGSDKLKIGQVLILPVDDRKKSGATYDLSGYEITWYCSCAEVCCKGSPSPGICADGTKAEDGTLASDWKVLPKGFSVKFKLERVKGEGKKVISGTVHDKGGDIDGKHIDVWIAEHSKALHSGRKSDVTVTVTVP